MHPREAVIEQAARSASPNRASLRVGTADRTDEIGTPLCRFFEPGALPRDIANQWSVLADHAAEPNAFAERWFLEPSLAHLAVTEDVRLAVVTSPDGLLVGLMPLTVKPNYGRIPIRNVQNWQHANAFLGTPLIRAGLEAAFWHALFSALDECGWATGLAHFNGLVEGGPVLEGLRAAGRRCDIVKRYERALLRSDLTPENYWAEAVRGKKRKELRRQANRLSELGSLEFRTLARDEDCAGWVSDFLELEARGWKGDAASALGCDDALTAFFTDICTGAHREGKLDFHRLDLDGKPIAMLVNFFAAPGGFSFKIAFDEDYARYSPGVLIEQYNLRVLERDDIDWMDSCASEDHPMINSLWHERRSIVLITVPLGGRRNRMIFNACRATENAAARAKGFVRSLREKGND
ncbi:GNAT family N-acetyltransferase [uncultured Parasphingopyxis sp.]|uniref:GNAT family N-acetyltransferase n=1 Tax=uncultured Parasphingopyxis sp. TaxID=1547918 RepID=UPI0026290876|nr:GNAT family N-acetyltransferase [uncultured Parasphingopyxis sp.]